MAADIEAAGLSVSDLATRSGISKDTLTRALGGGSFKVVDLAQVADVLGRTPPEWFAVAEQPR